MSRAKEIQEKLALNAKLQLAFSSNTAKVLSWLDDDDDDAAKDKKNSDIVKNAAYNIADLEDSRKQFFQLPVVQIGSGLSMDTTGTDGNAASNDIHTIGEFMNSDKKISTLAKKKKRAEDLQRNNIYRIAKDDTRAMIALKNKIRSGKRQEMRRYGTAADTITNTNTKTNKDDDDDDDSSDDGPSRSQRHPKKTVGLLFDGKKKKRR